jgi:hypothetical protein
MTFCQIGKCIPKKHPGQQRKLPQQRIFIIRELQCTQFRRLKIIGTLILFLVFRKEKVV